MKILSVLLLTAALALSCAEETSKQSKSDWTVLFDGSSLDGWRAYNGDRLPPGWGIVDGELTFSTEMVKEEDYDYKGSRDLIYGEKEFENFDLYLEWKIPPGGNSGIFYHVVEGYDGIPEVSPEYQLIDDLHYVDFHRIKEYNESIGITKEPEKLQPLQSTGADYAMYSPDNSTKKLNLTGEWNSSRIVFTPERVEHWLNGELLFSFVPWSEDWNAKKSEGKWGLTFDYGKFKKGFIGLQDHGSSLWFRNIKIKEL